MDNILPLLLVLLCLCLEGIFSGGELALVASDVNKIRQRAQGGSRQAKRVLKLLEKPDWFLKPSGNMAPGYLLVESGNSLPPIDAVSSSLESNTWRPHVPFSGATRSPWYLRVFMPIDVEEE